jgi:t-SNARE complex subunit (syntaxin)
VILATTASNHCHVILINVVIVIVVIFGVVIAYSCRNSRVGIIFFGY